MKGVAARKLAVEVLVKVEVDNAFANLALSSAFKRKTLPERDRAFVTALVQGVLRHRGELDQELAALSTQPLQKMKPVVRNLLRVALFQLKYMSDIPASAVLNTATEIGKTAGHAGIGKFVTGVLRGYLRKTEGTGAGPNEGAGGSEIARSTEGAGGSEGVRGSEGAGASEVGAAASEVGAAASEVGAGASEVGELAARYSVPEWLVARWLETRGRSETEGLLRFSQSVPPLIVRACESGITADALMNLFTSHGIKVRRGDLVDSCFIIEDRGKYKGPISKIPGYDDGLFIVQDEAAAFASRVVDPKPGEIVVDLCAAPGGKAIHMAEMMEGSGRVLAVDVHEGRLNMLKQTRQRVGLTNIQTYAADGTTFDPGIQVDKVLIDAPCTGTGVINRRADLRFKRQAPDVDALVDIQRRLLDHAAEILKPGGALVYSTCSIEPEENLQNLEWFHQKHPEFRLMSLEAYAGAGFMNEEHKKQLERGWIQLLPTEHGLSGFFVAKLQKP